ncbi:unnamed protein product [Cladocopium goreaui]|uniref:Alcohol dehydrogenase GroESlike domain containing protein n=1 Tax=Cladocopium goreaui TaxID=2562237 RepID=A0A9P1DK27_9DINO|nr:unnamed protein product [Cladocopium goreaui]
MVLETDVVTIPGPKLVELRRQPVKTLGFGEALVAVKAVGVCATDVELFDGTMGYYHSGLSTVPLVPGHEWAGEILKLGPAAPSHLHVGQRVIGEHCTGCYPQTSAETQTTRCKICCQPGGLLRCPQRKETGFFGREGAFQTVMRFPAWQLHVLPPGTPWELAVLAEPLATACKAVRLANLNKNPEPKNGIQPWVVVVGDGAVGLLLLQVLRVRERVPRVCLVGAQPTRLKQAEALGAELAWNVRESPSDLHAALADAPPSLVLEAAGTPEAVKLAVSLVAPGGTVILLGLSGNKLAELCTDDVVLRQLTLRGSLSSEPEDWQAVQEILAAGKLSSVVTHAFEGLEKYQEAIENVRQPPDGMIKVIVTPKEIRHRKRQREETCEMFRIFITALLLFVAQSDSSQEFLPAAPKVESDATGKPEVGSEGGVTVAETKEIEFDAASNPYIATSTTAECLALIFMIVACVICYLECCKLLGHGMKMVSVRTQSLCKIVFRL